MLNENQLKLLRHLSRFNLLDYPSCLDRLNNDGGSDRTALSYAFRLLTKNRYVSKDKRGCVSILAKGRALFPELEPLLSAGGGEQTRQRIMEVSRMAALMERSGILVSADRQEWEAPYFIPSACWRRIAPGILSTTRFTGMLMAGKHRLAVYDIGGGAMEWQVRAEGSLFYTRYGSYEGDGYAAGLSGERKSEGGAEHHPADDVEPPPSPSGGLHGAGPAGEVVAFAH